MEGNVLSMAEVAYLLLQLETRMKFIIGDVHKIACVLDLRYLGTGMSKADKNSAENAVREYQVPGAVLTGEGLKMAMFIEYTRFLITAMATKDGDNFRYKMIERGSKTILQYWQVDCNEYKHLQVLGCHVFSLAVSSAASE
jgi:hypothetical protein